MNRLVTLLAKSANRNLVLSSLYNKRLVVRSIASKPVSDAVKSTVSASTTDANLAANELNKPQWERSDKYV
jgi:hypothetical protein